MLCISCIHKDLVLDLVLLVARGAQTQEGRTTFCTFYWIIDGAVTWRDATAQARIDEFSLPSDFGRRWSCNHLSMLVLILCSASFCGRPTTKQENIRSHSLYSFLSVKYHLLCRYSRHTWHLSLVHLTALLS